MKICALTLAVFLFSSILQAEEIEIAEISENCLYDAQQYYSKNHGWKYDEFSGLVTDGGGYGIYKKLTINVLLPKKGEIIYEQGKLSTKINELHSLAVKIAEFCSPTVNKSSKKDAVNRASS
jgi:hypothetical protein